MTLSSLFKTILNRRSVSLDETHKQIEAIKKQHNEDLDATVRVSVAKSKQAGQNFDKIGEEMQFMADDIGARIAMATRNPR